MVCPDGDCLADGVDGGLDGGAERDGFVGVLRGVEQRAAALVKAVAEADPAALLLELRAIKPLADEAAHERHPRLAADEDDLVELFGFEFLFEKFGIAFDHR